MSERTMNAIVFREHGGPEVLSYEQVPRPTPQAGEVLVRVRAASLNALDSLAREGRFATRLTLPHVGGSDAAGEIVEIGDCVHGLAVGDRVVIDSLLRCGRCDVCNVAGGDNLCSSSGLFGVDSWGGFAEYAAAPSTSVVCMPDGVSFDAAASVVVAYTTAWHGLVSRASLTANDTLLVTAAGSGIGTASIQFGRLLGARVIATTSQEWKQEKARELGADAVYDSRDPDSASRVREFAGERGVTIAIDNLGAESLQETISCLGRGGRLACSGATTGREVSLNLVELYRNQLALHFNAHGTGSELRTLLDLTDKERLQPVIDSRFRMRDMVAAHEKLAASRQFGKVVFTG